MKDNGSTCKITLDGTDCPIFEPQPFHPKWFSHKFKGPGVRYEVGVCLQTGWIVWTNGPYPCGSFPDIKIARDWIVHELLPGEKYLADGGYNDGRVHAETPTGYNTPDQRMKKLARARHETVNKRIKQFKIFQEMFRHKLTNHGICFKACANITQIAIQSGEPLFSIEYDDTE